MASRLTTGISVCQPWKLKLFEEIWEMKFDGLFDYRAGHGKAAG
jgi:hypothetical protein